MKFCLVDRIESLQPPQRISTVKCLTSAEEYLADHFPAFPVMPGVLMLEACVQAAAWLVRLDCHWSRSLVLLKRARNVRYANFVAPGMTLHVQAELTGSDGNIWSFKCTGSVEGGSAVQAKLDLYARNAAGIDAPLADADRRILAELRQRFTLIGGDELLAGEPRP